MRCDPASTGAGHHHQGRRCPSPPSPSPARSRPDELAEAPGALPAPVGAGRAACASTAPRPRRPPPALGLATVGDLLEHLPRDRREARVGGRSSSSGETATVVVEVRSIASRPVRRRGMRPLVEATVADGSGTMKATFFNQPWLASKLPGGDAAGPARQVRGAQPLPRPGPRAHHRGQRRARRASRTTRPPRACPRRRSWPWCARTPARWPTCPSRCPPSCGCAERLPGRRCALTAVHLEGEAEQALGRRRLAFDELLLVQLALLRRRAAAARRQPRRRCSTARPS